MRTLAVTGSASGLGAALKRRLEGDGQRVIGVDRRDAEVVADLGTPEGRQRAVDGTLSACRGRLDGLVACAGLGPYDEATEILRVNFFGALASLDGLRDALARGERPSAVAISSLGAAVEAVVIPGVLEACHAGDEERAVGLVDGSDGNTGYVNAKRALAQAVRRRAPEWGALGVRLNAVAPGKMETPMLDKLLAHPDHGRTIRALPVPLGRSAPADEIASVVAFLLGPEAAYVHGHVLFVDGGTHALMYPDAI